MFKPILPFLICLVAATAVHAQGAGGRGARGGGSPNAPAAARRAPTPLNQLQIVGVVKAIDPAAGRITIAYDAVEPLNWPPGTMPFPVSKTALLNGVTVGEKVRFSLDSGSIAALKAFDAP